MSLENRIQNYDLNESFSRFSSLSDLNLFTGPQGIDILISEVIKQKEEEAKKEGRLEAFREISSEVIKQIESYVMLLTRIVDFITEMINVEFKGKDIKIIQARTNFDFNTFKINILFIIDANPGGELAFLGLSNGAERAILESDNFIAELFYINKRGSELDESTIECDYPFIRKSN